MARINRQSWNTKLQAGDEVVVYRIINKKKAKEAGVKVRKGRGKDIKAKGKKKKRR